MLNFISQSWKSAGVTSLGRFVGSAVALIFINLFTSGLGRAGIGGGGTAVGPPAAASARWTRAALALLTYWSAVDLISATAAGRAGNCNIAIIIVSLSPSGAWRSFVEAMVDDGSPSEAEDNIQANEVEVENNNQTNKVERAKQSDNQTNEVTTDR